jgi:hypothetical protein
MKICIPQTKLIKGNISANIEAQRKTTANSTCKKLAVQWLNDVLWLVSSSVVVDKCFEIDNFL